MGDAGVLAPPAPAGVVNSAPGKGRGLPKVGESLAEQHRALPLAFFLGSEWAATRRGLPGMSGNIMGKAGVKDPLIEAFRTVSITPHRSV